MSVTIQNNFISDNIFLTIMKTNYIISAAGGNNTAIQILNVGLTRAEYEEIGLQILKETSDRGVEQVGFLIPSENHFEMSGGEFCGNATRSAALLFSKLRETNKFDFSVSGFNGTVAATVNHDAEDMLSAVVSCRFDGLSAKVTEKRFGPDLIPVVDLGGIVQCVLQKSFPKDSYEEEHKQIIQNFELQDYAAVGVLWLHETPQGFEIHPVTWVKSIDTFFYETSSGSASIAAAIVSGSDTIFQPSGKVISVFIDENGVELKSEMREVME